MFAIHDYPLFVLTAILLNLTPGPDTMFILSHSVARGRAAGVASALGISAGCLVHTLGAALGLSAILTASALAFSIVKWAGASYLIFIGLKMILARESAEAESKVTANHWIAFRQGMLTNMLNPKVAIFFLALLPQFIKRGSAQPFWAFIALGLTFIFTGTVWGIVLAYFASAIRGRMKAALLQKISGLVIVGLGLKLAAGSRS